VTENDYFEINEYSEFYKIRIRDDFTKIVIAEYDEMIPKNGFRKILTNLLKTELEKRIQK